METTRCAGSDCLADSPLCPSCRQIIDRYRDSITGRDVCFRFVPHSRSVAEPPAELIHAIRNEPEAPDLERILIGIESDLGTVASWMGTLTDADLLHALQIRLAAVSIRAESMEEDALRLRRSAA